METRKITFPIKIYKHAGMCQYRRWCQQWPSTGPILATNSMFTGLLWSPHSTPPALTLGFPLGYSTTTQWHTLVSISAHALTQGHKAHTASAQTLHPLQKLLKTYFTCLYHHSINFLLTFWSLNSFNPLINAWAFVCVSLAVVSFSKLPLAANFFFCMALKLIRINSLKQWNSVRKGQQYINSLNIYVLK